MMLHHVIRGLLCLGLLASGFGECRAQPPGTEAPASSALLPPFPIVDRPEWPLIEAVRNSPWDPAAVAALARWFADRDPPRSELVTLQAQRSRMDSKHPDCIQTDARINELLKQHRVRWAEPATKVTGSPDRVVFRCGLIDELDCQNATDEELAALSHVPELRVLHLTSAKMTLLGFKNVARLRHLDSLTISKTQLFPAYLVLLERLRPWTVLRLNGSRLDQQAIGQMNERRIAQLNTLTKEQQYSAAVRFASTFDIGIRSGVRLTEANLIQAGITDAETRLLAPLTDLQRLTITDSDVTEKGLASLASLQELKHLRLARVKVTSIEPLAVLTKLESLELLPYPRLGDAGVAALENLTHLKNLVLADSEYHEATVRRLSGLQRLEKLDLTLDRIRDTTCFSALAGLTELRELRLHGPKLPGSMLRHLAGMTHLQLVHLRTVKGTGTGLRHLAGLKELTVLDLSGDGVTDLGLPHLSQMTQLKTLRFYETEVTSQAAKTLAASLPRLTILFDEEVIKLPRTSYTLKRQRLKSTTSLLLPQEWEKSDFPDDRSLTAREEWRQNLSDHWGDPTNPATIYLHFDTRSKSAAEALGTVVRPRSRVLEVIQAPDLKDRLKGYQSCLFENHDTPHLVLAVPGPDGFVILDCSAPKSRFNDFRPLFDAVMQSLRVDPKSEPHADETVEFQVKSK
ncbi:MAG: inlA 6 [Planctomycetaceae bacterium]|nr:inlA 6 [Planctomycetaceae bacterium]